MEQERGGEGGAGWPMGGAEVAGGPQKTHRAATMRTGGVDVGSCDPYKFDHKIIVYKN
jgi:hypothetical protein